MMRRTNFVMKNCVLCWKTRNEKRTGLKEIVNLTRTKKLV